MKGEKAYKRAEVIFNSGPKRVADASDREKEAYKIKKEAWYQNYFQALQKAAWEGHPEAQNAYGKELEEEVLMLTLTVNKRYNPRKAFYWFSKACAQQFPDAYNNLGALYFGGRGCEKNIKKALELFKKAADGGDSSGKTNYRETLRDIKKGKIKIEDQRTKK